MITVNCLYVLEQKKEYYFMYHSVLNIFAFMQVKY